MTNNTPNLNREMFYDRLVARAANFCDSARQNGKNAVRIGHELRALREAKVFYIDSMTLDSLLNEPYSLEEFSPDIIHIPFPNMFFEFESGLKYRNLEGETEGDFWVNGLLYSELSKSPIMRRFIEVVGEGQLLQEGFSVSSFGNYYNARPGGPFDTITFCEGGRDFMIEKKRHDKEGYEVHHFELSSQTLSNLTFDENDNAIFTPTSFELLDDDNLDIFKMANLVVNLIDYINSENVEIIPRNRERRPKQRRQRREGPLKPYYLIEVKKEVYRPSEDGETDLWSLDYRVWVRGHFQRYHTRNGVIRRWLIPHIRGPENAPWKNNRYLMLYKNFRHRLASRGNEDIGTSLEDSE